MFLFTILLCQTLLYVLRGLLIVNVKVSYCPFKGQKKTTLNLNLDQPKITVLNIKHNEARGSAIKSVSRNIGKPILDTVFQVSKVLMWKDVLSRWVRPKHDDAAGLSLVWRNWAQP